MADSRRLVRCRLSAHVSAHVWRARAGQATGRFWVATKCNKSDNSTWQMPAQKNGKNAHRFDISQTSTATQCGQLPASGDATRTASNINYILNRAGGLSLVETGNRRGYRARGTGILGYPYPVRRHLGRHGVGQLACSHGRRRSHSFDPGYVSNWEGC
jgi:hypothetical protein